MEAKIVLSLVSILTLSLYAGCYSMSAEHEMQEARRALSSSTPNINPDNSLSSTTGQELFEDSTAQPNIIRSLQYLPKSKQAACQ